MNGRQRYADPLAGFRSAILATLGHAPETIEPGKLKRFSTSGRHNDASGWCRLFDDCRAGVFGCWRLGISETWTAAERDQPTHAERLALQRQIAVARPERDREQAARWRQQAGRIAQLWAQTRAAVVGDPVDRYLRQRLGVSSLDVPAVLRLHPSMPYAHDGELVGTWPAMVAPIVSPAGRVVSLHRTYLDPEGRKADVPGPVKKLTPAAGLLTGASIRLAPPDAAGNLGVAEGLETALAASVASGVPTMAAYSAGALAGFQWPAGVRRLVVFADHDPAGQEAAEKLRQRAIRAGLAAPVLTPMTEGADWCDVVCQAGATA